MQQELKKKLTKVVELLNEVLVNPDIDIDYSIPDVAEEGIDPYVLLTYLVNETHTQKQKIPIKQNYLKKTPEDLANLLTFYIEQFIEQIDSLEYGAQ